MNVQSSLLVILPFVASGFPYIHTLVWGFIMRDDTMSMNSWLFSPRFGHSECWSRLASSNSCNPLTKRYTGHGSHFTTLIRLILHMALKPGYIGVCFSFPRVCLLEAVFVGFGNEKLRSHGDCSLEGWLSVGGGYTRCHWNTYTWGQFRMGTYQFPLPE
ncbi:hypothetical protein F5051DRAFT_148472 [Lentinula edodes]|nr:hypothetical protein F5051DRAFT_148472 [Lentinula edodes]